MDDKLLVKDAMELLRAAGMTGALKGRLLDSLQNLDGSPLTPEQRESVWGYIEGRGWVASHMEPIWHNLRWTLTERGLTALEGM